MNEKNENLTLPDPPTPELMYQIHILPSFHEACKEFFGLLRDTLPL